MRVRLHFGWWWLCVRPCQFGGAQFLIYDCVSVVESQFVNLSAGFPELKVRFSEVVFEVIPWLVRWIGTFPRLSVVFENLFFVENNKCEVNCLTMG